MTLAEEVVYLLGELLGGASGGGGPLTVLDAGVGSVELGGGPCIMK